MNRPSAIGTVPVSPDWSLWKEGWFRSCGFSVDVLRRLAEPELAAAAMTDSSERFSDRYREAATHQQQVLRALAGTADFRTAIAWQSPKALRNTIDSFLRKPLGTFNAKAREAERLIARYVQRYCAKNDTIGWFGPAAWFDIDESRAECMQMVQGPEALARKLVRIEPWALLALGQRVAEVAPGLLRPRRVPSVRLVGPTTIGHGGKHREVPPEFGVALRMVDGHSCLNDLAHRLVEESDDVDDAEEALEVFEQLVEAGVIFCRFEIPVYGRDPRLAFDVEVRRLAAGSEEATGRAQEVQALLNEAEGLLELRDGALLSGLERYDRRFRDVTGGSADRDRGAGQVYAARRPLYVEAERDLTMTMGRTFLDVLSPGLTVVLRASAWFCEAVRAAVEPQVEACFRRLAQSCERIPFVRLMSEVSELFGFGTETTPLLREVQHDLRSRWARMFEDASVGSAEERYISEDDAESRSRELFPSRGPAWPSGVYHCPDLMLAAPDTESIQRGNFFGVLGEVHAGWNTQAVEVVRSLHPDPRRFEAQFVRDTGLDRMLTPMQLEPTRVMLWCPHPNRWDVEMGELRSPLPRDRVWPLGELDVFDSNEGLRVGPANGGPSFDLWMMLERSLYNLGRFGFGCRAHDRHVHERLRIGQLVIQRKSFVLEGERLAFAHHGDPADRFRAAQRLRTELCLPARAFFKCAGEPKPQFVHFDSPVFVENLAHAARRDQRIALSEMLPDWDQVWFRDSAGQRYASEFRLVAVDRRGGPASSEEPT